ncbi:hypothetical protein WNY37_03490 [Henriciella sp. AS95]|uniref:TetR/AcrR family transcriptional regulator n=1 Tax=Henriciella sp. AS95 TaxID=3135782 RepID=UPI003181E95C
MARPVGVRNPDFEKKKSDLIDKLTSFVLSDGVALPSMRQLAIAADTSQPTLNHYFSDRDGVIIAVIERLRIMSEPLRRQLRYAERTVEESIAGFIKIVKDLSGNDTYLRSHSFSIREGMVNPAVLKAYIEQLVDPAIDAIAERIVKTPGGSKNFATARVAARALYDAANSIAMRTALAGMRPDADEFERQLALMENWFLHGFLDYPDGPVLSTASDGREARPR